jgi:hypothetical protein
LRFEPYYTYQGYYGQPSLIGTNRRFKYSVPPFQRPFEINAISTEDQNLYFSPQQTYFEVEISAYDSSQRFEDHKNDKYYAVDLRFFTANGEWNGPIRVNVCNTSDIFSGERAEVIRIAKGSVLIQSHREELKRRDKSNSPVRRAVCHPFGDCVHGEELGEELAMTSSSRYGLKEMKELRSRKHLVLYGSAYGTMLTRPTLISSLSDLQTL